MPPTHIIERETNGEWQPVPILTFFSADHAEDFMRRYVEPQWPGHRLRVAEVRPLPAPAPWRLQ